MPDNSVIIFPDSSNKCRRFYLFICLCIFLFSAILKAQTTASDGKPLYGIAFLRTMYLNVDQSDAQAAINLYIDNLQKQLNFPFALRPVMYENTQDLLRNFSKDNLAVITLSSVEFLLYKSKLSLYPIITSSGKNDPYDTYIILTRKDQNISSIEELAGKKLGMLQRESDPIPYMWIDVLAGNNKTLAKQKAFGNVIIGKSESHVILSLFFGQIDACVVSKTAFDTMRELNPQIDKQVKILKSSPQYLKVVSSFTASFKKTKYSENLLKHLTELDKYPAGRQLFALTKTSKIISFKDEYMDNIRMLLSDYEKLPKHLFK